MLEVTIVVGNPKPASRTLAVARAAVDALLGDAERNVEVVDLAAHAGEVFAWPSPTLDAIGERVAASDLAVFASPTYKASYTGLLKAFLDRYGSGALTGVAAIPVLTGADLGHSMGGDQHLRPLLVELGASVPTSTLYVVTGRLDELDAIVAEWAGRANAQLAASQRLAAAARPRDARTERA